MKHDSNAFYTFLEKVLNVLSIKYPMLQKCVYFSGGAGFQYKNFKALSNLCHYESDSGLTAEWNFFATSHGRKALAIVLEVLSNVLLVMQVSTLCKNQSILC